jgi:hypothetical protein
MAKRAPKEQVLVVRGMDTGEDEPEIPPDDDELRAIAAMDGGSDVKWTVMRTSDHGEKKAGFCGELSTGDVSMAKIAEEWGRGKYRVRGTRSNGTFVKQYTIVVAEEPKRPAVQTLMPAGPANSVQDFIALMDARAEREGEKWLKWAAILSPLLAPAIANLFSGSKGTTLTELTTALANVKALEGGNKVDQMSEFTKIMELVDHVRGDDKSAGSTWADIARDAIGQVGPVLGGLVQMRSGQPLPSLPKTDSPPAPQGESQPQGNPMLQLLAWFKSQIEGLIYQASRNRDPLLYAEVVLDNLPAGADLGQLRGILGGDDWWQKLSGFAPGVQPYPQWFAECRAELLKGLDELLTPPGGDAPPAAAPVKAPKKAKT